MAFATVFRRYELKYLLSHEEKKKILEAMASYMMPDRYGVSTIRNIYLDTDTHRLIRRSMEKPSYKEKIRIRSYIQATNDSTVFVELKKKYEGVVYKRRLALCEREAMAWVLRERACPVSTQISREIDYFLHFYGQLKPTVFLSYDREAYYGREDGNFRVTFDENILCRQNELTLTGGVYGTPILPEGKVLMELKCVGGIPLWMARLLSHERIFKTSFSKYAMAYKRLIFPDLMTKNDMKRKERIIDECII